MPGGKKMGNASAGSTEAAMAPDLVVNFFRPLDAHLDAFYATFGQRRRLFGIYQGAVGQQIGGESP